MGSSSSKPRYSYGELPKLRDIRREDTPPPIVPYYPYPPPRIETPVGYPPQTNPGPYFPQPGTEPQFGYFIRQRGDDPDDVEMIPGYYYPTSEPAQSLSTKERKRRQRRHQSAPTLSSGLPDRMKEPQVDHDGAAPRTSTAHPTAAPPPRPPTPSANQLPLTSEAPIASAPAPEHEAQPADPTSSSAEQPVASPGEPSVTPSEQPQNRDMTGIGAGGAGTTRRVRNPLPSPPIDVLETEKYRGLRRTKTDSTGVVDGDTSTSISAPRRSGINGTSQDESKSGQISEKKRSKRDSPIEGRNNNPSSLPPRKSSSLTQPRSPKSPQPITTQAGNISAESTRSPPRLADNSSHSNGLLRTLTFPAIRPRKLKKHHIPTAHPPDPDYTGYPHPIASTKYSSKSVPLPKYTPSPLDFPVDTGPPFTFYLHSNLNPASPHPVIYKDKVYPTGAHLFEAFKFLKHKPELAERIRVCSTDANEMSMLSWQFQMSGYVREDWEFMWRKKLDEVLYLRFTQHENLRAELMGTGYAQLVDGNEPRPEGVVDAPGINELGKGLMRLRERLKREGERDERR